VSRLAHVRSLIIWLVGETFTVGQRQDRALFRFFGSRVIATSAGTKTAYPACGHNGRRVPCVTTTSTAL